MRASLVGAAVRPCKITARWKQVFTYLLASDIRVVHEIDWEKKLVFHPYSPPRAADPPSADSSTTPTPALTSCSPASLAWSYAESAICKRLLRSEFRERRQPSREPVNRYQGSTFRSNFAEISVFFSFSLVTGKWNSGIFRHFSFSNFKIQKYL